MKRLLIGITRTWTSLNFVNLLENVFGMSTCNEIKINICD